jgi:hypothetical protein
VRRARSCSRPYNRIIYIVKIFIGRRKLIIIKKHRDKTVTTTGSSFTLAKSGATDGTVTYEGNNNVATFTLGSELDILATYTATLGTAITDLSGNPLAADYSWSFTTSGGAGALTN